MNDVHPLITVLLVEDSPDDVYFFRRAIRKSHIVADVQVAADGMEAVHYMSHQGRYTDKLAYPPPDVVFLDLKLPHLNGFEVLAWMGRQTGRDKPPVVVLTSSDRPEDRAAAQTHGIAHYMLKPPAPELLRSVIIKILTVNEPLRTRS